MVLESGLDRAGGCRRSSARLRKHSVMWKDVKRRIVRGTASMSCSILNKAIASIHSYTILSLKDCGFGLVFLKLSRLSKPS